MSFIPKSEFEKIILPLAQIQKGDDYRGQYYGSNYLLVDPSLDYSGCIVYKCILSHPMNGAVLIDSTIVPIDGDIEISADILNHAIRTQNPLSAINYYDGTNDTLSNFKNVTLENVIFKNIPNMGYIDKSSLKNCTFRNVDWTEMSFYMSDLSHSTFIDCYFYGVSMDECDFRHCTFINCHWDYFDGPEHVHSLCYISDCNFSFSQFESCTLGGISDIINDEHQQIDIKVISGESVKIKLR